MEHNKDMSQIAGAIIIAGIIIGGAILLKDSLPGDGSGLANIPGDPNSLNVEIRPVSGDDHILGNKNAKIVIVEYSDTECPFCKNFHRTMQEVVKQNDGEVAWVYRHYPIPELHSKAPRQAEATECAYEQGGNTAFWKYIDRMFGVTPSNNGLPDSELENIAEYVGLNSSAFYTCLQSGKYKDKVADDIADGRKAGVSGTPSSLILVNGKVVDRIAGAQPLDIVLQMVNQVK